MVKKSLQAGDPRLKAENFLVTDFNDPKVLQVITDLVESMRNGELVGMAAPQIGENYQIFVTEPRETPTRTADQADELRIFINPKIVFSSEKKSLIYEGCGSFAHGTLFGPVVRPKEITVEAFDKNGKKFQLTCDGLLARVIQHEYDHLSGIEFIEKVSDFKLMKDADFYVSEIRNLPQFVEACKMTKKIQEKKES